MQVGLFLMTGFIINRKSKPINARQSTWDLQNQKIFSEVIIFLRTQKDLNLFTKDQINNNKWCLILQFAENQ